VPDANRSEPDEHRRRWSGPARWCAAAVLGVLAGSALMALVASTPLQEVSFRWTGLAGVALPVSVALAALGVVGSTGVAYAAPRGLARSVLVAAGLTLPWVLVLALAWPTLTGLADPRPAGDGAPLDVLAQNLWYQNRDPDATAAAVLAQGADVLVLVEYTPAHQAAFVAAGARERYPYRWEAPAELGDGLAVLSRVPLRDPQELALASGAVRVTLDTAGGPVQLYAVHPTAPSDYWGLRRWTKDYRALSDALAGAGPMTVVAGDFNATGAHRRFRELLSRARLVDAQDVSGSGFGSTWPSGPVPPVMRLDHVLVGEGIGVQDVTLLDDVGADHLGVRATLRVPGASVAVG
jgi:endonuclease/exonuclease/phosphatase (EEP) superfamily protein YafD